MKTIVFSTFEIFFLVSFLYDTYEAVQKKLSKGLKTAVFSIFFYQFQKCHIEIRARKSFSKWLKIWFIEGIIDESQLTYYTDRIKKTS